MVIIVQKFNISTKHRWMTKGRYIYKCVPLLIGLLITLRSIRGLNPWRAFYWIVPVDDCTTGLSSWQKVTIEFKANQSSLRKAILPSDVINSNRAKCMRLIAVDKILRKGHESYNSWNQNLAKLARPEVAISHHTISLRQGEQTQSQGNWF